MSTVIMNNVVSVDGFIADAKDQVGPLFDWYVNGDVEIIDGGQLKVSQASADYVKTMWAGIGSMVIGRHLFDITNGWEGVPPAGDHVVVVSHRPKPDDWRPKGLHPVHPRERQASYYFISDVARAIAGRPGAAPALPSPPLAGGLLTGGRVTTLLAAVTRAIPYCDSSRHHHDEKNEQYQLGQTGRQRYVDATANGLQVLQGNHLPQPRFALKLKRPWRRSLQGTGGPGLPSRQESRASVTRCLSTRSLFRALSPAELLLSNTTVWPQTCCIQRLVSA